MKIRKYDSILLEIEELSKDEIANGKRLKELAELLDSQRKFINNFNMKEIKESLKECNTYEEYNAYKNLLKEKKTYMNNDEKINAILEGNYKAANNKRKLTLKKGLKTIGILGLGTALGISLFSCVINKGKNKDKRIDGVVKEYNDEETINNNATYDNNTNSINNKETNKDFKNSKNINKDQKENTTEKKKDDVSNNNVNKTKKGLKPKDETTITTDNSDKTRTVTGYTGKPVEKILKENVEVNTDGKLPIEPSVTIIDNTKENNKKDTYVEETNTEKLPPITNVEGNNEITHEIPNNNTGEKEYDKEDIDKKDTVVEEKNTEELPPISVVEGNDEKTYDVINKDSCDSIREYEVIEDNTFDLPSLDNEDEASYIEDSKIENYTVTDFTEIENIYYEDNNYELPSFDNVEEDYTEELPSSIESNGKTYSIKYGM